MESWLGEGLEDLGTDEEWVDGDHAFKKVCLVKYCKISSYREVLDNWDI